MIKTIYVLQFDGDVRAAHLNYESAKEHEDYIAIMNNYKCVGRWELKEIEPVRKIFWKAQWRNKETQREIISLIHQLEL
jgi:hypothetical protein